MRQSLRFCVTIRAWYNSVTKSFVRLEERLLRPGQALLLNNRRWQLRQVQTTGTRRLELEAIGVSEASLGMTRRMQAIRYGDDLFIEQRRRRYWHGHLQRDWVEDEHGPALKCEQVTGLDLLNIHTQHPASGNLKNEFSWSYSRAAKYRQCPRAYYYHYYAAWEGWRRDAARPVQRAYLLKNLTDLSHWVGNLVHESIKFALARLKAGQAVPESELIKQMHIRAQADYEDSRSGRFRQQPNQLAGFQEHYYRMAVPDSTWQRAWARAEQYLRTFLNSDLYADLCRQPADSFLTIEELQSFSLGGTRVWVQMDLARRETDAFYLYDWKTGSMDADELRQQLGVYGLYARQTWPELAESDLALRGIVYLLAEDRLLEFELDEATLQEIQAEAETSIARLQGLLIDPRANLAELQSFPMIEDLSVCHRCQFRELCGRDQLE